MASHVSERSRQILKAYFEDNEDVGVIAARHGVSKRAIYMLASHERKRAAKRIAEQPRNDQIIELVQGGMSINKAAKQFGITRQRVSQIVRRAGIDLSGRQAGIRALEVRVDALEAEVAKLRAALGS